MAVSRSVLWALLVLAIVYIGICAALYLGQRAIIYPAHQGRVAPYPGFDIISYQTSDGLTLEGGYHAAEPGKPTLLIFYGNASNWAEGAAIAAPLAKQGYGVMAASYRGYSENPGSPSEQGLYSDARGAHAWLADQGVSSAKIVIVGNSIGSGVAVQLAAEITPAAMVLISPFSALSDLVAEKARWLPTGLLLRDRYDSASKLGAISVPVLILHGDADSLIPVAHARILAQLRPDSTLITYAGAGHDLAWRPQTAAAMSTWLAGVPSN